MTLPDTIAPALSKLIAAHNEADARDDHYGRDKMDMLSTTARHLIRASTHEVAETGSGALIQLALIADEAELLYSELAGTKNSETVLRSLRLFEAADMLARFIECHFQVNREDCGAHFYLGKRDREPLAVAEAA